MRPDTIFAPATAPGRAAIAVIRVSGPDAAVALTALAGDVPRARQAVLRTLRDPRDSTPLDQALVLWFQAPASATGEDVAEFHVHGGRAVVNGVLEALGALPGLRPAEPGEFTRRGFLNGRLDLTAVEGLSDLLAAETAGQRRQALRQMGGALATRYEGWRDRLARALAHVEAVIDFPDEDVPETILEPARGVLKEVRGEVHSHLVDGQAGERLRDGVAIAVLGPPNAGKSSLVNALARREVAIVTDIPGTTRDVLEVALDLGGVPVLLYDTAGLRETADRVEVEGVRRALTRAHDADIRLVLRPYGQAGVDVQALPGEGRVLEIGTKWDLSPEAPPEGSMAISVLTGAGMDLLLSRLRAVAMEVVEGALDVPLLTRARHRHALEDVVVALDRAGTAKEAELFAEDGRLALRALGRLTGRVEVDDLLGIIFSEFCIGK